MSFKRKATRQDLPAKRKQGNRHVFYAPCSFCGRKESEMNTRIHIGEGVFKIVCQECLWKADPKKEEE